MEKSKFTFSRHQAHKIRRWKSFTTRQAALVLLAKDGTDDFGRDDGIVSCLWGVIFFNVQITLEN